MIPDVRWHLYKLASFVVKAPPLMAFPIGDPVVDEEGHSLIGGPLFPGASMGFEPCEAAVPFKGCDHYRLVFDDNKVEIAISGGAVQAAFYDYGIYRESGLRRMSKLRYLLREHAQGDPFMELVDNGSAILYRTRSGAQHAVHGYLPDTLLVYAKGAKPDRARRGGEGAQD